MLPLFQRSFRPSFRPWSLFSQVRNLQGRWEAGLSNEVHVFEGACLGSKNAASRCEAVCQRKILPLLPATVSTATVTLLPTLLLLVLVLVLVLPLLLRVLPCCHYH